ncbi:MAG: hypothetical protein HOP12_05850 [Candidatus Eisenbacteria bacterium]|uniref:Uncharacterized protein n=1 Tax=Eiseniibacteriota bacterium TaxID=2212470 RepID=A0A849SQK0_UNCEI|nr:hypothetical protein [Candidatus Eisenbacteria bacterium]
MMHRSRFALVLVLTFGCVAAPAHAHITSDRESRALASLDASIVARTRSAGLPDSSGWAGANARGARRVSEQAAALRALSDAAARIDSTTAERAWTAIEAAMRLQRPGGGFEFVEAPTDSIAGWRDAAVFLAELNRAIGAVMNSPLKHRFRWRWALLRPKLERAMNGLAAVSPRLEAGAKRDPALLLTLAESFLLADGHYHLEAYGAAGQRALAAALALQTTDGRFRGATADRQARCLDAIEALALYFPGPFLDRASARLAPHVEALGRTANADALAARSLGIRAARLALPPPLPGASHQATPALEPR